MELKKHKSGILLMTEGSPVSLILLFSVPMLIGNLFQQVYNLVDSVIVGKYVNADALAAIGATGSVTFLFFAICNGIGSGGGIITSQCFGKKDDEAVKSCIVNTGYIMLVFPIIVGFIAYILTVPILTLLDTPAEILKDAADYMKIMCVGLVFVSLYNYISSMLRALGDSKTPLFFLIFSCLLNTGLDFLFVVGFGMSVRGAGIATVISQLVSGVGCMLYAMKTNSYFKFTKENMKYNKHITMSVLKLGLPLSFQFSMIAISCMALQKVVNSFGKTTVAAFSATSRIEQIIHQPYQTLGAALSTFTGQNYGANLKDRVKEGYKKSLMIMVIFSIIMLPIMQLFSENIVRIFVDEEPVIVMGAKALRITSYFYVMLGTIYTVRGVLNGLGDSIFALLNGIVEVIGRFTVPFMLVVIPAIGLWGIWWSVGIVWSLAGITAFMRYFSFRKRVLK